MKAEKIRRCNLGAPAENRRAPRLQVMNLPISAAALARRALSYYMFRHFHLFFPLFFLSSFLNSVLFKKQTAILGSESPEQSARGL